MAKIEELEDEPIKRGEIVRVTIVMPPTMYDDVKSQANENRQLIGEHLRDIIREYLDTQKNLVACEDDDCEYLVDKRLGYCPNCGEDITFEEPEDNDDDEESE